MTNAIPKDFHSVTPFFMAKDPDAFIKFVEDALGGEVTHSLRQKNGKVWHAQIKIGNSMILVGDAMGKEAPPMNIYIYTEDADAMYKKAMSAGGTSVMEPADQFYGDRNGGVKDTFGNIWWIATHIEDVSDTEMEKRARAYEEKMKNQKAA